MGDFRDAISSVRATWRKSVGAWESSARRVKSARRSSSSLRPSASRERAQTILAPAEPLFSTLMDNLPGFFWMKDLSGRYVYANQRVKRLIPSQNGWLGKTDAEIWPGEIGANFRKNDVIVATTGKTLETVEPCHSEGQDLWVLVNKFPVFDSAGLVVMVGGAGVDITSRKRAEEALREAEEKYRSIFEHAVEGIFQTTPDGRFVAANPAIARMFGFDSPEELISTRTNIAQEHYVEPRSREEFKSSMERNGFVLDFELEAYRKDGSKIWISENVRAVRDHKGTVIYYEGTTQDITARKRAEEALRESEERYRDLVENSLDLICTHDLDGVILSANRAAMELMGYAGQDYAGGTNLREILAPEVRNQLDDYLRRIRADEFASGVMLLRTRTGEKRIWEYRNTLRTHGVSVPIVRGMARDVTEQRRTNHSLRLFRALIDRSSDAIEVIDPNTLRFLDCNESAYKDLGYTREEFLALSVYDIDPLVDERMLVRIKEELDRSGFVIFESVHRRKDGSTFLVEINLKIVRLERDYRLAAVRDITERKATEEALLNAERRYRDIFENAVEGIFQIRAGGGYISANPALARMLGFNSPEELIRERTEPLKQRCADPGRRQEYMRLLAEEGVVHDFEYEDYCKDGSRIWLSDNVRTVRDSGGTLLYYEGTTQNITQRKRVERAQRESQRQYETLVHSINGIVWEADPKTFKFTFVSKQAERILGYPLERWFEGPDFWPDHMHSEDRDWAVAFCVDATERRVGHRFEYRMIAADGSVVWFSDIVTVDVADNQTVVLRGVMVDITERKLAEEKLRQSETQLAEAQKLARLGSWTWNLETDNVSWSDELYQLFGIQRSDFHPSYEAIIDSLHQEDRDLFRSVVNDALTTHEPFSFYYRIIRADGAERIIHSRGLVVTDEHGKAIRMFGAAQDVTEGTQAENALREAERKYRDIFENAGEGIFQSTPDGRFIAANPALARMQGFASPEELIHSRQNIAQQVYVDPSGREWFKRLLENEGAVRGFEHEVFRKDGTRMWTSVNARTVRDKDGVIQYYEGTAQDITDRKRAEAALRESEERYRELFENAKDATYVHDLSGKYTSVNRATEKLSGYTRDEILGKSFFHFVPPEQIPKISEHLCRKLADEGETSYEAEIITKDGRRVAIEVNSHLIFENGAAVAVQGTARDITERKAAEEKLKATSEQLRALSARLQSAREEEGTRIAREIHDELGSVLTSLKWDLEVTDRILASPMAPSQLEALRERLRALMNLSDLAIGAIRRISSELRPSVLDDLGLPAAIEWQAQQFQARTGIVCYCDCSLENVDLSEEQATAVFRILQEALTNVLRHAQATTVDIKINKEQSYFSLSIGDNGKGITESEKAGQKSLGILGMRERAHLIGGEIDIRGDDGKGTVVIVRVPLISQARVLKMTH